MEIRLDSFLSKYGVCSRREAKEIINNGLVEVNGHIKREVIRINEEKDKVTVNNNEVSSKSKKYIYIILNKPKNVLSTTSDDRGRKTVLDFIHTSEKVYPVGRLDYNSTGLILLTNDGDLALKLTHPRYHIPKKYVVYTEQSITNSQIDKLKKGVIINNELTLPTEVKKLGASSFEIILKQGIKRQIREMCKSINLNVIALERVSIGNIELGDLEVGKYRILSENEVKMIKDLVK